MHFCGKFFSFSSKACVVDTQKLVAAYSFSLGEMS